MSDSSTEAKSWRLSFKGVGTKVATQMLGVDGTKALALSGGATVVDQEFQADPVALGQVATGLLDVLPVKAHASTEYAYLRQTVRTNNAAVVAEGAAKPTSVYSVTRIKDKLVVVAHLSEGIPRYWLLDNTALERFVDNELQYGLQVAVEAKVLSDVNGTSGIQTQAYTTCVLTTLRKGLTKLEVAGYTAGAFVLHPNDWEAIELALLSTSAVEFQGLSFDAPRRTLWGLAVTVTNAQMAGVAHTLASGAVGLNTDTAGVQVAWSEMNNATDWATNMIRCRVEGRFATSVFSPGGCRERRSDAVTLPQARRPGQQPAEGNG